VEEKIATLEHRMDEKLDMLVAMAAEAEQRRK